jgi:hypothetical protein
MSFCEIGIKGLECKFREHGYCKAHDMPCPFLYFLRRLEESVPLRLWVQEQEKKGEQKK